MWHPCFTLLFFFCESFLQKQSLNLVQRTSTSCFALLLFCSSACNAHITHCSDSVFVLETFLFFAYLARNFHFVIKSPNGQLSFFRQTTRLQSAKSKLTGQNKYLYTFFEKFDWIQTPTFVSREKDNKLKWFLIPEEHLAHRVKSNY